MAGYDQISELLDQIDMEAYLDREGIQYRLSPGSRGLQLNVRECPCAECGSTNWKVYLNAETGYGNCFSGGHPPDQNYSKFSFIREHLGNPGTRAVVEHLKSVAREMGWRARKVHSAAVEIVGELTLPESLPIPIRDRNLKYLADRNIDVEVAQYFHLRYSSNGKFGYTFDGQYIEQDYSKRIIIPIFDEGGKLVSFQGRDITGEARKKYLFPPGFASTGRYLYNGHNAHGAERIVIAEGVFDVMAVKLALDEEMDLRDVIPVGTFGKHLSSGDEGGNDQLSRLLELKREGLREVTFMWDGEPSALADAARTAWMVRGYGLETRIAILPPGKDPNEVPPDVVRNAYWQAKSATRHTVTRILMGLIR